MDSGLGVQWPLSPFATAVATGALLAFCVTLFKQRYGRSPAPESDSVGISSDDPAAESISHHQGESQLLEYRGAIKKHVLKLEIPKDVIDTSSFGFSSISNAGNSFQKEQLEVLTFALPRISDHQIGPLTVNLIDFDGRYSKLNFAPYLKGKIDFSPFSNPLIPFPKLNPREGLRFRLNGNSYRQNYRYPFPFSSIHPNKEQENVPGIFRNFNVLARRSGFLEQTIINNRPITFTANNILPGSSVGSLHRINPLLRERKREINLLENKPTEISDDTRIVSNEFPKLEINSHYCLEKQVNEENKCDTFNENAEKIAEPKIETFFEIESGTLNNHSRNVLETAHGIDSNNEKDKLTDITEKNSMETNRTNFKVPIDRPKLATVENINLPQQTTFENLNGNVNGNIDRDICVDETNWTENDILNKSFVKKDRKLRANFNDKKRVEQEDETNSEIFFHPIILESVKQKKDNSENDACKSKNEARHIFETYGSSNCQNVVREEPELKTRASGRGETIEGEKSINYSKINFQKPKSMTENLERVQGGSDKKEGVMTTRKNGKLSLVLETKQTCTIQREPNRSEYSIGGGMGEEVARSGGMTTNDRDVRAEGERGDPTSRSRIADERGVREARRQMDRRTGERSDAAADSSCLSVTSETRIHENGVSTAVTSSLTLDTTDAWSSISGYHNGTVKTVVSTDSNVYEFRGAGEGSFRPTYEEYMPDESKSLDATINELKEIADRPLVSSEPSSPRVSRLKALLSRDEERRARMKFFQEKSASVNGSGGAGASIDGEWDRILRDVLASVSELEHWEKDEEQRRRCDVTDTKREDAETLPRRQHHSDSSPTMEGEEVVISPTKGETPTKVKNLRFKLDPDVFDVPSDDSFYDEIEDDRRPGWRRQAKYRTFSTLELNDEPVKLVSVHASVVPAGQKMVARPVGIDLHVRLTEERQSKRAHVGSSPSQVKRRSPVSDTRVGWCQELSPVTENVDWRETFSNVPKDPPEPKPVPNGILKSPSPKMEPAVLDSANPFKVEGELTNGTPVVTPKKVEKPVSNGVPWKLPERKPISLPRKKFLPDPEAVDRITGYKLALSKPPLPPPVFHKGMSQTSRISRAELARKQYLDSKAALAAPKVDSNKKFQQFLTQAQNDRTRIVASVPDLGAIEKAVNEQWARERTPVSQRASPMRDDVPKSGDTPSSRGSTPDDAWSSYVQSCRKHLGRRSQSMTYLETDVDIVPIVEGDDKWRSTSALVEPDNSESSLPLEDSDLDRSHEDLDDSGRAKSEHELRIQRSLQSLPLPSWYKHSEKPKSGFLLGSAAKEKRGWAAAKSLASSTSSLASCGLRRPIRSLRSSRENIPWSRGSPSPDGPTLSLALARAFREPYLGWRARTSTTSSGVSSSPRTSPPSWSAATTDEEVNGVSFDGEDAFGRTSSQEDRRDDPPSGDDTGADAVTVSMDTGDLIKLPGGEDTCDDINNMSMDTCEFFDISIVPDAEEEEEPSPQADTGDDIDNLSTDTTEDKRKDPKFKRYSYSQSIYHSEWEEGEESRGDRKSLPRGGSPSSDNKVIWIESSFVGSRTTTSIIVLPDEKRKRERSLERPASR